MARINTPIFIYMPIIIDKYSIPMLNGPVSMAYLTPIEKGEHPILLFGDIHTEEDYNPCNDTDCIEINTDF